MKRILVFFGTRPEAIKLAGVERGSALLVGSDENKIVSALSALIDDKSMYEKMRSAESAYGDGKASVRIADAVCDFLR